MITRKGKEQTEHEEKDYVILNKKERKPLRLSMDDQRKTPNHLENENERKITSQ